MAKDEIIRVTIPTDVSVSMRASYADEYTTQYNGNIYIRLRFMAAKKTGLQSLPIFEKFILNTNYVNPLKNDSFLVACGYSALLLGFTVLENSKIQEEKVFLLQDVIDVFNIDTPTHKEAHKNLLEAFKNLYEVRKVTASFSNNRIKFNVSDSYLTYSKEEHHRFYFALWAGLDILVEIYKRKQEGMFSYSYSEMHKILKNVQEEELLHDLVYNKERRSLFEMKRGRRGLYFSVV